jgi:Uma2 family endonuclease
LSPVEEGLTMSADASQPQAPPAAPALYPPPECLPDLDNLIVEDGQPVESVYLEKLYRLLTDPLYVCWSGPGEGHTFMVFSNVGLFFEARNPALVPDVMLAIDPQIGDDLRQRENRSYFVWERGKPPDVVIEVVSDRRGDEASYKKRQYARGGVPYYVIFDPDDLLGEGVLRAFERRGRQYADLQEALFPDLGLGLQLWQGSFEGWNQTWLRWTDARRQLIPTAAEALAAERQRRESLEARLRELGQEP